MAQAVRIEDVPFNVPLPAELRRPPDFEPSGMHPEILAELRRRADAARQYREAVLHWATTLKEMAEQAIKNISRDTVLATEMLAVKLAELELASEKSSGEAILTHEKWRRVVVELMEPSSRAAWLGYLDPFLDAMKKQIEAPRELRHLLYNATQQAFPDYFGGTYENFTPERMLNSRAAEFFRAIMSLQTGVRCDVGHEIVGDEVIPVVSVHVPSNVIRPQRAYAQAEEKAFAALSQLASGLAGRVAVRYLRSTDAA